MSLTLCPDLHYVGHGQGKLTTRQERLEIIENVAAQLAASDWSGEEPLKTQYTLFWELLWCNFNLSIDSKDHDTSTDRKIYELEHSLQKWLNYQGVSPGSSDRIKDKLELIRRART